MSAFSEAQINQVIIPQMEALLHPNARATLVVNNVLPGVRDWLLARFHRLGFEDQMEAHCDFNPWNQGGYGIQSVTVKVVDPEVEIEGQPREILFRKGPGQSEEFKHPTIGIPAEGMLEGEAEWGIADFEIEAGKLERLLALSPRGLLVGAVLKGTDPRRVPERLPMGYTAVAPGKTHVMRAVIELLKRPDAPRPKMHAVLKSGVYACTYELDTGEPASIA